jgi:hypothetical protein
VLAFYALTPALSTPAVRRYVRRYERVMNAARRNAPQIRVRPGADERTNRSLARSCGWDDVGVSSCFSLAFALQQGC